MLGRKAIVAPENRDYHLQYYYDNKEEAQQRQRRYINAHPERYILKRAKKRARNKGQDFNLTETDFKVPKVCPILGMELVFALGKGSGGQENSPTLDRLDNDKGYVPGNVNVISSKANRMKSNATVDEVKKLYLWMKRMLKAQKDAGPSKN